MSDKLDQIKEALRIVKLDKDAAYLIIYDPKELNPEWLQDAMQCEEFEGIKAVSISSYDVDKIKFFNLKEKSGT